MIKLFGDLKTDEEKSAFFLSGRGYETGVIAAAIQNDVAMAYHRCAEYKKELAALQAECERLREKLAETKEQSETRWAGYVRESNLRREIDAAAPQPPAEAQARPEKPAECADGCPPQQVCDHCQWPLGPDAEAQAQGGGEVVAWMVYTLDGISVCVTDNPADFMGEHRALPLYTKPFPTDEALLRQALEWIEVQPEPRMIGAAKIIAALRERLISLGVGKGVGKREHITDGSPCWCNPETTYTDPDTGVSVIVHKEPQ